MVEVVAEDRLKHEQKRLKRNEYARQYRERNKSDIIDDASEEKRFALNAKAKMYRDRRKAAQIKKQMNESIPCDIRTRLYLLGDHIDVFIKCTIMFIGVTLMLFILIQLSL
jgi:hypothetical protein